MTYLNWILYFIQTFISTPAILIGLFSMIGGLLLKKPFQQIIVSTFKVIVGFLILGGGAGVLVGSLVQFQPVFQAVYSLTGIIPNNDAFAGALASAIPSIATLGSCVMVCAMVFNITLAIFSRFKYVFLSGHVLYYMCLMLSAIMYVIGFDFSKSALDFILALFTSSTLLSIYMVISPHLQQKYMVEITKSNDIALGHTGGFSYALSGWIGEQIYKVKKGNVRSTEDISFPQSLYFLRNTLVSISLTVLVFYMIAFIPGGIMYEAGKITSSSNADAHKVLSSGNWVITMFTQAFMFAAGVEIILYGVRMFIGELVPMYKGFSDKLIKDSKPAVDCPVVFPYAPNAVLIGFISSFTAGILGMLITIGLGKGHLIPIVILPGLIPHFFLGATSGVFGNVKGGILGAIVGSFVTGLIITLIPVLFVIGNWAPKESNQLYNLINTKQEYKSSISSLNWGDTDYSIGYLAGLVGLVPSAGKWLVFGLILLVYGYLIVDGILHKKKDNKSSITLKEIRQSFPNISKKHAKALISQYSSDNSPLTIDPPTT